MRRYDPNVAPDPAEWRTLDESMAQVLVERHHRGQNCDHPSAPNPQLHATIHVIVENQVAMGDRIPAAETVRRLMAEGLTRHDAIHAVGSLMSNQIYTALERNDEAEYSEQLRRLTAAEWRKSVGEYGDAETEVPASERTDLDEIVAALRVAPPQFPATAIRAAECARGRINDRLIELVAETRLAALDDEIDRTNGPVFAMLLLAEFEDPRGFDVIADLLTLPEAVLDRLLGDFLTEDMGRVLASLCAGRTERLAAIVEDRSRSQWARCAALSAVAALVQRRQVSREQAGDYLRLLLQGRLEDEPSAVWAEAANLVLDLYVEDLFDHLRAAMRRGLINQYDLSPQDIDQTAHRGCERALTEFDANPHHRPVRDVIAETQWWATFRGEDDAGDEEDSSFGDAGFDDPDCDEHGPAHATVRRDFPKIGRNDPCPCGSGRKYKKCCLPGESAR